MGLGLDSLVKLNHLRVVEQHHDAGFMAMSLAVVRDLVAFFWCQLVHLHDLDSHLIIGLVAGRSIDNRELARANIFDEVVFLLYGFAFECGQTFQPLFLSVLTREE